MHAKQQITTTARVTCMGAHSKTRYNSEQQESLGSPPAFPKVENQMFSGLLSIFFYRFSRWRNSDSEKVRILVIIWLA